MDKPRDESKKFEVAPESMSADTGSERPGIRRETRKETSECKVRVALIWTGVGCFIYSHRYVLGNHVIQVEHLWRWTMC